MCFRYDDFLGWFFVFLIGFGCSNTSKRSISSVALIAPPESKVIAKYRHANSKELKDISIGWREKNLSWWRDYKLALLDSNLQTSESKIESCQLFSNLAKETEFPLWELAKLRAQDICKEGIDSFTSRILPSNLALHSLYYDLAFKKSKETPDSEDDLFALKGKISFESNVRKKEELILQALKIAKKLRNQSDLEKFEEMLYKVSPRFIPGPALEELPAVAADFRSQRQYSKAIAIYKRILKRKKMTFEDKFMALMGIRKTFKIAQQKTEYVASTYKVYFYVKKEFSRATRRNRNINEPKLIQRFQETVLNLARTLWTEESRTKALKIVLENYDILKKLREKYNLLKMQEADAIVLDEFSYLMGRIHEESGDPEKALIKYEEALREVKPNSPLNEKLLWTKSWLLYKSKRYNEAVSGFESMVKTVRDPSDKNRARYWLARSFESLDQKAKATEIFSALKIEDPVGFYGALAYRITGSPLPALKNAIEDNSVAGDSPFQQNLLGISGISEEKVYLAEWLISLGEKSLAEKTLNQISDDLSKGSSISQQTWLRLYSAFARAELYLPLFAAIGAANNEIKAKILAEKPELLFPDPYLDLVKAASEKYKVPSELIYSIMRQESNFNPEARSVADALGLMQLLPSIAKSVAQKNKIEFTVPEDLYKPEVAIALGALELKSLLRKYKDQYILAVASYNANAGAIRSWVKNRLRKDPTEFIEEIPYDETRTYIKLVFRNFIFYTRLLAVKPQLDFPEFLFLFLPVPD